MTDSESVSTIKNKEAIDKATAELLKQDTDEAKSKLKALVKTPEQIDYATGVLVERNNVMTQTEVSMLLQEMFEQSFEDLTKKTGEGFSYDEAQDVAIQKEINEKMLAAGFTTDVRATQEALIQAGYLKEADRKAMDGKMGKITMKGLDDYKADIDIAVKKEAKHQARMLAVQGKNIMTMPVDSAELNFDSSKLEVTDSTEPSLLNVQQAFNYHQQDSELLQSQSAVLVNGYSEFVKEVGSIGNTDSTAGEVWNFAKSALKTATLPFYAIASFLGAGEDYEKELKPLRDKHEKIKKAYKEKAQALRLKKAKIDGNGAVIEDIGEKITEKKTKEQTANLGEYDENVTSLVAQTEEQDKNKTELEAGRIQLQETKNELEFRRQQLEQRTSVAEEANETIGAEQSVLIENQTHLDTAIETIKKSLDNPMLNVPQARNQKLALQIKMAELISARNGIYVANTYMSGNKNEIAEVVAGYNEDQFNVLAGLTTTDGQLLQIESSQNSIEGVIKQLEIAKLKNGTEKEQMIAHFEEYKLNVDELDNQIDDIVPQIDIQNTEILDHVDQGGIELDKIEIKGPNLWEETMGGVAKGLGAVVSGVGTVVVYPIKQVSAALEWVAEKDIPLFSGLAEVGKFATDVTTGVIEGVTGLATGITTMVEKPVETMKGLGALIGTNPNISAGEAWTAMAKGMIAYDEFEAGNVGVGIGKAFANIGTFFLPGSGAGIAAKVAFQTTKAVKGASLLSKAANIVKFGTVGVFRGASAGVRVVGSRMVSATGKLLRMPGRTLQTIPVIGKRLPKILTAGTKGKTLEVGMASLKKNPNLEKVLGETVKDFVKKGKPVPKITAKLLEGHGLKAGEIAKLVGNQKQLVQLQKLSKVPVGTMAEKVATTITKKTTVRITKKGKIKIGTKKAIPIEKGKIANLSKNEIAENLGKLKKIQKEMHKGEFNVVTAEMKAVDKAIRNHDMAVPIGGQYELFPMGKVKVKNTSKMKATVRSKAMTKPKTNARLTAKNKLITKEVDNMTVILEKAGDNVAKVKGKLMTAIDNAKARINSMDNAPVNIEKRYLRELNKIGKYLIHDVKGQKILVASAWIGNVKNMINDMKKGVVEEAKKEVI